LPNDPDKPLGTVPIDQTCPLLLLSMISQQFGRVINCVKLSSKGNSETGAQRVVAFANTPLEYSESPLNEQAL
jgi:hypothetical protein